MEKKLKKNLICFDLDNTLINSNKTHIAAFQNAFAKNKLKKISSDRIKSLLNGRHAHDIVKIIFPELNNAVIIKIVEDHHKFVRVTSKYAKQIGNVNAMLKDLKKRYKIGLLSNCIHKEINVLLKSSGIEKRLFDYIIGKEDVRHSKPYPDEIFKVEHLAHLKADYMVGDSIYDIIAAKKAGVTSISVLTGLAVRKELLRYKPDYILNSVKELPRLLKKIDNSE